MQHSRNRLSRQDYTEATQIVCTCERGVWVVVRTLCWCIGQVQHGWNQTPKPTCLDGWRLGGSLSISTTREGEDGPLGWGLRPTSCCSWCHGFSLRWSGIGIQELLLIDFLTQLIAAFGAQKCMKLPGKSVYPFTIPYFMVLWQLVFRHDRILFLELLQLNAVRQEYEAELRKSVYKNSCFPRIQSRATSVCGKSNLELVWRPHSLSAWRIIVSFPCGVRLSELSSTVSFCQVRRTWPICHGGESDNMPRFGDIKRWKCRRNSVSDSSKIPTSSCCIHSCLSILLSSVHCLMLG